MGNVFISLDENHEELLRKLAQEEYGGKKGSISLIMQRALDVLKQKQENVQKRLEARQKLLLRIKNARKLNMLKNKKAYESRDELYER